MDRRTKLSLLGKTESEGAESPMLELGRFPGLAEAGGTLGLSGPALRKKFDRGDLPRKFLLRVGPRTLRVDITGLVAFLKGQANQMSA